MVRRRHTVDQERTVLAHDDVRLLTLDTRQIPGNGFKQIGLGDDASELAIFVEDNRQATALS